MKGLFILKGALGGCIHRAKIGHKKDARRLAAGIAELLREGDPLPEMAKQYLIDALQDVADGKPGNQAFHTSGRRGVRESRGSERRMQWAAFEMQCLINDGEAKTPNEASLILEDRYLKHNNIRMDSSTFRKAYRKHITPK